MEQPGQKKPFPWKWTAVGCAVVILAVLIVVFSALVITRVLPSLRVSLNNSAPLTSPNLPSVPNLPNIPINPPSLSTPLAPNNQPSAPAPGNLPFTISALNDPTALGNQSLMDAMTTALNLNTDTDFQAPKSYTGSVSLDPSSSFTLGNGWCAKDDATLKDNLAKMKYTFSINGQAIDLSKYPMIYFNDNQGHSCALTGISITPNANISGSYKMKLTQTYLKQMDDGITATPYPAGDVSFDFSVEFKGTPSPGINL